MDVDLSTKGQKPERTVALNRGLAGNLGLTNGQVAHTMRPAFAGIDAGDWVDPAGETRDVQVRFAREAHLRTADLGRVPLAVAGPQGPVTLPLGQVAEVRREMGPAQIDHLDRERVISVQANTQGRPLSEVVAEIQPRLQQHVSLPPGYTVSCGGETEDSAEVAGRVMFALLVAVMLGLWLTGNTLNIMSMIGIILLAGIVAGTPSGSSTSPSAGWSGGWSRARR